MFLLDSNRYARDPNAISKQIDQMVAECGGEMLASRLWSEQKLAYPIEGHRKGTYWLTYFRMDSLKQVDLNRACKLNENVLRNLIIKIDDRLVDTLVEHAKGTSTAAAPAEAPAAPEAPKVPAAAEEAPAAEGGEKAEGE
ncbi:MAG: 30S ribosomal protein S6 [Planctomycetaceae bacterium]|nr:30S ribosomal protein S6 [Planctomycetaceae bacterium]